MLGDIDGGKVNLVLTKDLSRFGRDYIQSGYYIERVFARKNVRYIAVDDGIDTLQNSNDILMPIKNVLNDMYARDISRKTRAAFNAKAKSGQFIGSRAPFGYKKSPEDKHKLIVDEPAAEVIRKIFDLAEQGYGYNRIAKALRAENILNPQAYFNQNNPDFYTSDYWKRPFDWHTTSVRALLNNMAYLGHVVFGKERLATINAKTTVKMPEDEWIVVRDTHEAIISQAQWDAAHEMLRSRKRENSSGEVQMFAGLLYCPDCGSALSYHGRRASKPNGGEYSCLKYKTRGREYCSSHYIRYDALYRIVLTEIRRQACQAAHCEDQFRKRLQEIDGEKSKAQMAKARKQLEANEARAGDLDRIMTSLYEDKALGRITPARFDSMMGKYEAEQKALLE
jgi:DNA invertase Pin-like site-specific DNA recombinase